MVERRTEATDAKREPQMLSLCDGFSNYRNGNLPFKKKQKNYSSLAGSEKWKRVIAGGVSQDIIHIPF